MRDRLPATNYRMRLAGSIIFLLTSLAKRLLALQRADGDWGQWPTMTPDA